VCVVTPQSACKAPRSALCAVQSVPEDRVASLNFTHAQRNQKLVDSNLAFVTLCKRLWLLLYTCVSPAQL
jgi:hypothetical protein